MYGRLGLGIRVNSAMVITLMGWCLEVLAGVKVAKVAAGGSHTVICTAEGRVHVLSLNWAWEIRSTRPR